jgi:hypothetical protein
MYRSDVTPHHRVSGRVRRKFGFGWRLDIEVEKNKAMTNDTMTISRRVPMNTVNAMNTMSSESHIASTGSIPKRRKKTIGLHQCLLYLTLLLLTLIVAACNNPRTNANGLRSRKAQYQFYKPVFPTGVSFSEQCHAQLQTFHFEDGKVRWVPGAYSYLTRGLSMHCLLARAAQRLGPDFKTTIRIGLADMDLNSVLSFQPAATEQNMSAPDAPVLFPDSTFESWPEVHDYSLPQSVHNVLEAAHYYGLPGTVQWERRNPKVIWRGSPHGPERVALLQTNATLLDVQSTEYNLTMNGLDLASANQISRQDHCRHRFLLHMNGIFNNRYSSSIKWKLLCGSLVFVPTEPLFVEWWNYKVWQPHVHYVPYTSLSDLLDKIDYYNHHLDEAAIIARNGMELAQDAFAALPQWVDETLTRYAEATRDTPPPECARKIATPEQARIYAKGNVFKSLQDLQRDYGPRICAP